MSHKKLPRTCFDTCGSACSQTHCSYQHEVMVQFVKNAQFQCSYLHDNSSVVKLFLSVTERNVPARMFLRMVVF